MKVFNRIYLQKIKRIFILCALFLIVQGCATNPVTGTPDFVMMSESQEVALGKKHHQQILKQYEVYNNPELQNYVERIGENLAAKSHRRNLIFHFTLLDSPEVNAFALPGGYVYITRGIMAYMTKESHLAGVIGHEIGHVTARHGVRQQAQGTLAGILGAAVAIGTGNQQLAQLSNTLGGAIIKGYGRNHELESDRLGAQYIAENNYDPDDMIEVIGILKNQELFEQQRAKAEGRQPRAYHGVFASHPRNDTRLQEVIKAAEKYRSSAHPDADNGQFLRLTNNMTYGSGEKQGIVRANKFYHKELNVFIEFPQGWRVQNQASQIVAVSPDSKQAIQFQMDDLNQRVNAGQYLQDKFKNIRNGRSINTHEDQAYAGVATVTDPQSRRQKDLLVSAIYRDKKAFVIVAQGQQSLPNTEFMNVAKSIRKLKPNEQALATEHKIHLVKAKRGDTFAKLASKSSLSSYPQAQLRLINNMYPTGEPKAGQWIKVIR